MGITGARDFKAVIAVMSSVAAAAAMGGGPAAATEIDTIVVTAAKRDQPLQQAPLPVSALTQQVLENVGAEDIFDVAAVVPSLNIAQSVSPLSTSYYIRRIGNLGSIPNFESAVGLFIDGAFRSRPGAALGDLFDIRQIEVVRGPQTTLHGKNSTAGLVSIETNPPGDDLELQASLTTGLIDAEDTASLSRVEGMINAPVSTNVAVRTSGVIYRHGHTLTNLHNGDHGQNDSRYGARGQVRFANSAGVTARLVLNRFRTDAARKGDLVLFEGNAIRSINESFGVPCPDHDIEDRLFCRNHASVFDLTSSDAVLNVRYELGDLELFSISGHEDYESSRDFDADQLNIDAVRIVDRQRGSGFSQEVRLNNRSATTNWLIGAFYLDSDFVRGSMAKPTIVLGEYAPDVEAFPGIPLGEPGNAGYFHSESKTRHFSVFGNFGRTWHDAFTITAGIRWQTEDKRTSIVNTADHSGPTAITLRLTPSFANASLRRSASAVSWDLAARYWWSDAAMTYVRAAKGFKSGGFNAGFGATPPESREFGDETVESIEAGLKSTLRGGRLAVSAALFSTRYEDFQSAGWVSLRFLVNNAERVDVSGLELDLQAALSEQSSLRASLSWVDARYERYTNGGCYPGRAPDNANRSACDLSGRTVPLAPKLRAHVELANERPLASGTLYTRLGASWSGDYATNSTLDPRHVQSAHTIMDGRLELRRDRWTFSVWVRNAGNELVVMREGPSNLFPRDAAYGRAFAEPRAYGLGVSARL